MFVFRSNSLTKINDTDDLRVLVIYTRSNTTVDVAPSGGSYSGSALTPPSMWSNAIPQTVGTLYQSFAILDTQTNEISSWSTPTVVLSLAQSSEFDASSTTLATSPNQVRNYVATQLQGIQQKQYVEAVNTFPQVDSDGVLQLNLGAYSLSDLIGKLEANVSSIFIYRTRMWTKIWGG